MNEYYLAKSQVRLELMKKVYELKGKLDFQDFIEILYEIISDLKVAKTIEELQ